MPNNVHTTTATVTKPNIVHTTTATNSHQAKQRSHNNSNSHQAKQRSHNNSNKQPQSQTTFTQQQQQTVTKPNNVHTTTATNSHKAKQRSHNNSNKQPQSQTTVTLGGTNTKIKSQDTQLTMEKKILLPLLQGLEPETDFSTTELSPLVEQSLLCTFQFGSVWRFYKQCFKTHALIHCFCRKQISYIWLILTSSYLELGITILGTLWKVISNRLLVLSLSSSLL